jgi:hypothetical protein
VNYNFIPSLVTKEKKFVEKHEKAISLINNYDPARTASEQGYSGEYIRKELKSLKRDCEKILEEYVVYLCSDKKRRSVNALYYLWLYTNIAMAGLYRVAGVLAIEDYTVRDSLEDLLGSEIYKQLGRSTSVDNRYGRARYNYYDTAVRFFDKEYCFGVDLVDDINTVYDKVTKNYDRVLREDLTYTKEIIKTYSLPEQEGLSIDEIIPVHLKELKNDIVIQEYVRKASDKNLLLNQHNYETLYLAAGFDKEDYTLDKALTNISDIIDAVLSPETISGVYPEVIKMAITLGYGDGSSQ